MSNHRKPACIFYHNEKCVLRKVADGSIEKFDIYGEWDEEKATEFEELRGCPFIRSSIENRYSLITIRKKCEGCSKRVKWSKQHTQDVEAQRLENRGF